MILQHTQLNITFLQTKKIKSLYVHSLRTQELKSAAPGNWTTMWAELKSEFCSHSESSPEQKTRLPLDFCSQFESNCKWKKVAEKPEKHQELWVRILFTMWVIKAADFN